MKELSFKFSNCFAIKLIEERKQKIDSLRKSIRLKEKEIIEQNSRIEDSWKIINEDEKRNHEEINKKLMTIELLRGQLEEIEMKINKKTHWKHQKLCQSIQG